MKMMISGTGMIPIILTVTVGASVIIPARNLITTKTDGQQEIFLRNIGLTAKRGTIKVGCCCNILNDQSASNVELR